MLRGTCAVILSATICSFCLANIFSQGAVPESSAGRAWAVRPQGTASSRRQQHPSDTRVTAEVKFAEKIGLTRFFGGEHALQDPYESKSA